MKNTRYWNITDLKNIKDDWIEIYIYFIYKSTILILVGYISKEKVNKVG
jgi:hypothetical protein